MLPWGHAALGYLLFSLYSRQRYDRPPVGLTVYALGFGTQFPDLVDKPLTWTIPLLPYGRSLTHSLFTLGFVYALLWLVFRYPDQRSLTNAFGFGYVTHLLGDGIGPLLEGDFTALGYVLWPLTNVPTGESRSFIEFFLALGLTPMVMFGIGLTALSVLVWIADGMPGVRDLFDESLKMAGTESEKT
ncbi:metal-dependent hydrolase [Halobellus sp. GM3]|uniref:metal-dependent hydrolase n=1 Tax=Halobellus sp. GM3 TaxID=3458410 RepID=UPI00403D7977